MRRDNVVPFNGITKLDLPVSQIIERTPDDLQGAVVIGENADGSLYVASSWADGGTLLWWLERTKKRLMEIGDADAR